MGGRAELLELVCLLLLSGDSICRDSPQTQHLAAYQLTVPRPIGGRLRREVDGRLPSQASFIVSVEGNDRVVHLERNELLLPADFTVYSYSHNGSLITTRPPAQVKRAVLPRTHHVELLLVVDNDKYNFMNRNDTAVREEMVHLANFIDSMYVQLNIRVVLVGLEIWTQQNQISTEGGAGEVLSRFTHGSRNFSSCSADDFEKLMLLTGGTCLLNVPRPDEAYSAPYCGNRLVDVGEECDCGSQKYLPGGSVCRSSTDECDLAEYCNGSSTFCQSDVFVQAVTVFGIEPSIISTPIAGGKCYGVDFMLGSDVPDPGMVNEGTKCGDNKVCLNFECRSADVLKYDCDVETKCHGHGVCNSNRNCHCDDGWAPPFCEVKGYGGSVDSGPLWNDKDSSVRDGLLVFFFLVLPLLALGVFVFLRRNELLRRFGLSRRKRSQGYQADGAASANPSRGPPPRAQPPPVVRGNTSNIVRDGETETFSCITASGASETRPRSTCVTYRGPPPSGGHPHLHLLLLLQPQSLFPQSWLPGNSQTNWTIRKLDPTCSCYYGNSNGGAGSAVARDPRGWTNLIVVVLLLCFTFTPSHVFYLFVHVGDDEFVFDCRRPDQWTVDVYFLPVVVVTSLEFYFPPSSL
ncbi:hypothetical protein F2P81_025158 [Scophthalmus maximus]|uniref:Disintegrin and metalloproteinase domain-containing protein 9-like n=1 Tax=Scophthalmus maximus TaxID=52904 RepID=A0A6A4RU34_SCOMX|nr:hypothetical protein F2P81_025158 [Scophthalmus maximus]